MKNSVPEDPRVRNNWFDTSSPLSYLNSYREELNRALSTVQGDLLALACEAIRSVGDNGGHIYCIGNGGSAAIADHLCCDWTKGTNVEDQPAIKTHSLSSNSALLLAVANDFGFENCFSKQLEFYLTDADLLIAISSSGNSENVIRAVDIAKRRRAKTIGLCGFAGGRLREAADVAIFVASSNYGIVEDAHQALMHVIAQYTVCKREKR